MEYLKRPVEPTPEITAQVSQTVSRIIADAEREGTAAVRHYSEQLDGWSPPTFRVSGRVCDDIAPEHLELQVTDPDWFAERVSNYGSLFLGTHATVAYSDKAIGTNHTLPTRKAARYTGGLWVGKFLKTVTNQRCTAAGSVRVAEEAAVVADAEMMYGHAISARLRLNPEYFPDVLEHVE